MKKSSERKACELRKAFDTILSDYVDADSAAKNGGFEPYRYECARCGEEVHLCAADSQHQVTHFRHRSGNNNVECDNYIGNRNTIVSNALSRKNLRDKVEFYFSSITKMFSIGVKFNAEEIAAYEQSAVSFEVKDANETKPIISIPIRNSRFLPDTTEQIPIGKFSWEYYVSSTNEMIQRKYELFRKGNRGDLYPSFFKIQANGDDNNFLGKLVRGETLYTNTPYLIVFTHHHIEAVNFQEGLKVGNIMKFKTMNRDFIGIVVTFTNKTTRLEQQLLDWKYNLEANETLHLLWPPSPQSNDIMLIHNKCAYIYSSFEMKAHGNINVHSQDVVPIGKGVSKISVNGRVKVYRKNAEIILNYHKNEENVYDAISVAKEITNSFVASDNRAYLFNLSGVSQMSKGMATTLTVNSEVRHYFFGYLDSIITAANIVAFWDSERMLREILMYYKREESFNLSDFESLNLSLTALKYVESCEKIGRINSAAKHFIEEGRI